MTELSELHDRLNAAAVANEEVILVIMATTTWERMRAEFTIITGVASPTFAVVIGRPVKLDAAVYHPQLIYKQRSSRCCQPKIIEASFAPRPPRFSGSSDRSSEDHEGRHGDRAPEI